MTCRLRWYGRNRSQKYGRHLGKFNEMSSQSHLPHCRVLPAPGEFNVIIPELRVTLQGAATWRIQWHVIPEPRVTLQVGLLPLGKFTVMIPAPRATLQGPVTWRNQCRDRATSQGVRILSFILKIVFRHIFCFVFLMQFGLWRAAAFVSSPIHLLKVRFEPSVRPRWFNRRWALKSHECGRLWAEEA